MRLRAALILGLFWSTACSIDDDGGIATVSDSGSPDGTVPADAGIDAAAADAAPPRVPMGTEAIAAGAASALEDAAEDPDALGMGDPSSCWDEVDNDEDLESDCDDPACDAAPACALNNGRRCSDELDTTLTASSCTDGPATPGCLGTGEMIFGSPAPWVTAARLHPGGDDYDSGVVLERDLALRTRRVQMTGTFGDTTCPTSGSCIELASFGITTTTTFDESTRVQPTAVLQMSSARNEVALLIDGAVLGRWPFAVAAPEWTLDLRPTGEVLVFNGDAALLREGYAPPGAATAVVYGRNINRAEDVPGGAGVSELSTVVQVCNVADAWTSRDPITLVDPTGSRVDTSTLHAPSARRGGDGVLYLALEAVDASGQGRIVVAAEDGSSTRFALRHAPDAEIFAPSDVATEVTHVGDPELYWDGTAWHLYFTGDLGGERRIGHATGADFESLTFTDWVVRPPMNVHAVDEPSVTRSNDGRFILAVGMNRDGGRSLGIFVGATASGPFERHGALEMDTFRIPGDGTGFDADEIGAPSIRVVGSAYNLYFAARRGTRWSIGVWTSAEQLHWRPVNRDRGVLRGDGEGFDALGVRDPEILVEGPTTSLFYLGENGVTAGLGIVSRPRPVF